MMEDIGIMRLLVLPTPPLPDIMDDDGVLADFFFFGVTGMHGCPALTHLAHG